MNFARQLLTRGPVEIEAELDAEAPIERVFDLLDFAAPGNALRERGFLFLEEPVASVGRFKAVDPGNPDMIYVFDTDIFEWPSRIRFQTRFESHEPVGVVEQTISDYHLTSTGPETCNLHLVETCWLQPGLSGKRKRMEKAMLTLAVQRHITRLCIHAVLGADEADSIF